MRRHHRLAILLPAAMLAAMLASAPPAEAHKVVIYDDVYDAPGPPPFDQPEVVPPAPSERVVWKPGFWKWKDGGWIWEAGRYVEKPVPEAIWVPGHWVYRAWGSSWVPGHWE